jgi:hypothetical protein
VIRVPKNVWEGLEAVRKSGATNMLHVPDVIRCAELMGFQETAAWIQGNKRLYWDGVFVGFEPNA